MRIIDAVWEKRNLDVECTEFEIGAGEKGCDLVDQIQQTTTEYQVAKVEVGNVDVQLMLQDNGFKFYETNYQLERKLKPGETLPAIYKRFKKDLSYRVATEEEINNILEIVESGEMFTTDKVALDPHFSAKHSGHRYVVRARDMLKDGAPTVLGLFKGNVVSFTIYEIKDGYCLAYIGGMFKEYRDKGLGFIPLYVTAEHILDNGGKILRTGVSSNNPSILRLQLLFGAKITEMKNVFIKHM